MIFRSPPKEAPHRTTTSCSSQIPRDVNQLRLHGPKQGAAPFPRALPRKTRRTPAKCGECGSMGTARPAHGVKQHQTAQNQVTIFRSSCLTACTTSNVHRP